MSFSFQSPSIVTRSENGPEAETVSVAGSLTTKKTIVSGTIKYSNIVDVNGSHLSQGIGEFSVDATKKFDALNFENFQGPGAISISDEGNDTAAIVLSSSNVAAPLSTILELGNSAGATPLDMGNFVINNVSSISTNAGVKIGRLPGTAFADNSLVISTGHTNMTAASYQPNANSVSGDYAMTIGLGATASAEHCMARGSATASGNYSMAFGNGVLASGESSISFSGATSGNRGITLGSARNVSNSADYSIVAGNVGSPATVTGAGAIVFSPALAALTSVAGQDSITFTNLPTAALSNPFNESIFINSNITATPIPTANNELTIAVSSTAFLQTTLNTSATAGPVVAYLVVNVNGLARKIPLHSVA